MILDCDYTVRYAPFPPSVPALTAMDEEGHYNIYINCHLSENMQQEAFKHELEHLLKGDFEPQKPFEKIEPYRPSEPEPVKETVTIIAPPRPKPTCDFSIVKALSGQVQKLKIEKRRYPCIDIWADDLGR